MFTRTISALAAAGLTFVTLSLATPLHAAPIGDETIEVKIGDLDLATASGVATLDRRIRAAARTICGAMPANNLNMQKQVANCQDKIVAGARPDVETAIAAARSQQSLALSAR
jgi:UrcA family protein